MEIEIPDLQDLEFEEQCNCANTWSMDANVRIVWTKAVRDHLNATGNYAHPSCTKCGGSGKVPTPVGKRLLDFLKKHGLDLKKE